MNTANARYMDAPGGARSVDEMVNSSRTARLFPSLPFACLRVHSLQSCFAPGGKLVLYDRWIFIEQSIHRNSCRLARTVGTRKVRRRPPRHRGQAAPS